MALYLVQHGKALSKEEDPEQGLSQAGIADVRRIAQVARGYGVRVSRIGHSGKKRALQTAEILQTIVPGIQIEQIEGIRPMDDFKAFAQTLDVTSDVAIVGHLPFLEKLTAYLITGNEEPAVFAFQNGGIVCLDAHARTGHWVIKWALMPNIE